MFVCMTVIWKWWARGSREGTYFGWFLTASTNSKKEMAGWGRFIRLIDFTKLLLGDVSPPCDAFAETQVSPIRQRLSFKLSEGSSGTLSEIEFSFSFPSRRTEWLHLLISPRKSYDFRFSVVARFYYPRSHRWLVFIGKRIASRLFGNPLTCLYLKLINKFYNSWMINNFFHYCEDNISLFELIQLQRASFSILDISDSWLKIIWIIWLS